MTATAASKPSPGNADAIEPPTSLLGLAGYLGPGLIVASTLVGSGELIATTKTGAQAGISLLWLIVLGCVIKVFVQVELARYTISRGETTLAALNSVPGPRARVGWIVWLWAFISLAAIGVQGAIVGGVGQALAMAVPLRGDYVQLVRSDPIHQVELRTDQDDRMNAVTTNDTTNMPYAYDDKIWATVATVVTVGLLYRGRYMLIQTLSTGLVAIFTVLTIGNVVSLQMTDEFHIPLSDIRQYARLYTDALKVYGLMDGGNAAAHNRAVSVWSVVLPILSLAVYVAGANPVSLVLLGGLLNGVLLPAIGFSTVYFRYTRTDCRLRPRWAWDAFLILSCVGALIVGVYGIASPFFG